MTPCGQARAPGDRGAVAAASGLAALALLLALLVSGCSLESESPETKRKTPEITALVAGDSLSIGLADQLEKVFTTKGRVLLVRLGRESSGLTRPDVLDWPDALGKFTASLPPDVTVLMLGANDANPLYDKKGQRIPFGAPGWDAAYAALVKDMIHLCRTKKPEAAVFLVGAPPMGDPEQNRAMRRINAALVKTCRENKATFIDVWPLFVDENGQYARYAVDEDGDLRSLRAPDGVHLAVSGARKLAGAVLDRLRAVLTIPSNEAAKACDRALRAFRPADQATADRLLAAIEAGKREKTE